MIGKVSIVVIVLFSLAIPAFAQRDIQQGIPEFYATSITQGQIAFMWLSEGREFMAGIPSAGVLVKTSQHSIIIDPSDILTPDSINAIKSLDLILITHEHLDHFNAESTVAIHEKTGAPVVVSAGVYPSLKDKIANDKLIQMLPNDLNVISGITVKAIPARHPVDRPVMYLINMDGLAVFHGSDSGFVDELDKVNSEVHLAFVPVGGASPTASPEDAFMMVKALKPNVTVPIHGIFEQMKALQDLAGKETAVIIPTPNAVDVPNQIVPEFRFGAFAYVTAITIAIAIVLVAPIAMKAKPL